MEEVKAEIKKEFDLTCYPIRVISNPKQKSIAKKKQPQQQHESQQEIENPKSEKMSNLKLLNEILVKKTLKYRQRINTLQKSKEELESEITKTQKFKTENKELEGKLMEVKDANQLKKRIIKEKSNEIQLLKLKFDGVFQEKSELQDETNKLKKSVDLLNRDLVSEREVVSEIEKKYKNLKVKISELDKNQVSIQKKLSEVEMENEKLVQENKHTKSEKKAVEKKLSETLKALDDLKQDKERIALQKENIDKIRNYQLAKIDDLEKQVQELVAKTASSEKNRVSQFLKIDDLEKHVQGLDETIASLEKNDKMLRNKVAEENQERDEAFQGLLGEKLLIEQKLKNKIEKNRADQSVKAALENVKWRKSYTEALEKQQLLRDELHSERKKVKEILEKCYKEQMDANKHLKLEVGFLKDDLTRVAAEKSEIQKELELSKKEELSLSLKVQELQKSMDDTMKEIQEKSLLEKKLFEVEKENQCLTSKMESAQMNTEKALAEDEEKEASVESDIDMMKIEEDIQPFASELESIKKALEIKDKKVEEMTRQIEKLNKSAKRNSNNWILVSCATTILAAASSSYIARGW
ncbi:hypothetical protein MKW92_034264 [Papaver armeniacum]|nr:hypothetical protein MKW92_034264 [Papaver armeniacum]